MFPSSVPRKKRVFISFRAEDRQQLNGLRLLAANPRFDIEFYDESVPHSGLANISWFQPFAISLYIGRRSAIEEKPLGCR